MKLKNKSPGSLSNFFSNCYVSRKTLGISQLPGLIYNQNILFYNESGATVSISIKCLLGTYMAIMKPLLVMEKYLSPYRSNKRSAGVVALITPVGLGRNPYKEKP